VSSAMMPLLSTSACSTLSTSSAFHTCGRQAGRVSRSNQHRASAPKNLVVGLLLSRASVQPWTPANGSARCQPTLRTPPNCTCRPHLVGLLQQLQLLRRLLAQLATVLAEGLHECRQTDEHEAWKA
jgi:hypothetical protein